MYFFTDLDMGKFLKVSAIIALFLTIAAVAYGFTAGQGHYTEPLFKTKIVKTQVVGRSEAGKPTSRFKKLSLVKMPRIRRRELKDETVPSGVLAFRAASEPIGLYELSGNCTETFRWEGEQYWIPTTGFKYGNSIYGISALYLYETMYIDRMDYDIETGEMTYCESMDHNPEHAAITAVYDPSLNEAYAYAYTEDVSGYIFSRLIPETFEFIKINESVDIADVCLAMTYDEHKGYIVGVTTDSRLVKVNPTIGIGTTLATLDINQDLYTTSMAYCPDTNTYLYQMIDTEGVASMITIDADTYAILSQKKWQEDDVRQYTVMFSAASAFGGESPCAPEISGFDFEGAALSGTVGVVAPDKSIVGNVLTSEMSLELLIDNESYLTIDKVQPGAEAKFNVTDLAEGVHVFSVVAKASGIQGQWAKFKKYVGYDYPKAPSNVHIEGETALWDKVTEGESGGYIDASSVEYEVRLNGDYIGTTTDTQMVVSLPEMFTENQVSVIASANGKRSKPGVSGSIISGMLTLGDEIGPNKSEWECFTVVDNDNDSKTWEYDYYFGAYYSADSGEEDPADDWLILPAYKINNTDKRHVLSFSIDVEGDRDAKFKIYQGSTPELSSMVEVGEYDYTNGEAEGRQEIYVLPESEGKCYIAFRVLNKCSVYLESLCLSETDALSSAADNVKDISVKPDAMGNLTADVGFTLPDKAIDGTPLSGDVEVLVKSDVEEKTLTGAPGQRVALNINVPKGLSRLLVKTKNGSDSYSDTFFAGIDLPSVVENITEEISDDNLIVKLHWNQPTEGLNKGYINPETLFYSVSIYDPESETGWSELVNNIEATEVTYSLPAGAKYDAYDFLITAGNSEGLSETGATYTVAMGELYNLPMKDNMEDGGKIGPLLQIAGDDYQASWTTAYPEWYDEAASEIQSYITVCVNYSDKPTKGSLIFPKFRPAGGEKIMTAFKFFFGDKTPDFKLYVLSPNDNKTLLADVESDKVARGYQTIRSLVPDNLKDSAWLQIMLEVEYDGSEQSLIFPGYAITAAFSKDIAVTSISGQSTLLLGENAEYDVEIENIGYEEIKASDISFSALSGNNTIANGNVASLPENTVLQPGDTYKFDCNITVDDPRYLGAIDMCATLETDDKDCSNNQMRSSVILSNDCKPVVTDLSAQSSEAGVKLNWTEPVIGDLCEGFENCAPFADSDMLGDFVNIDNDGAYTYGYCFPYHAQGTNPTGWIVWDRETVLGAEYNNNYLPATGDRVAVAIAPCFYEDADDWLISPMIKGGSSVKFKIAGGTDYSTETLEVLASSTGRDMECFQTVEMVTVENMNWTEATVHLPSDARYFALRYCSNSRCCLVMVDDLEFTPISADAVFTGYDILRNGDTIKENTAKDCTFTDSEGDNQAAYRVQPVYILEGETLRGYLSNEASVSASGVEKASADQCAAYGEHRHIVVRGAMGQIVRIYSVDGKMIEALGVDNNIESIPMPSGIYLVEIAHKAIKVVVR